MTILDDMDATAWSATLAATAVCALFVVVEIRGWRKHRATSALFMRILFLLAACWCGIMGLDTLSAGSDAERSSVTGRLQVVGYLHAGRGAYISQYLACVTDCRPVNGSLVMEPKAQLAIKDHQNLPTFKVDYLMENERVRGNVNVFKVVDISDPATGASFYHLDTARHPVRAGLYFADTALILLTGLLGIHTGKV